MPDRKVEYLTLLNLFQMDYAYWKVETNYAQTLVVFIGLTKYDTGKRKFGTETGLTLYS